MDHRNDRDQAQQPTTSTKKKYAAPQLVYLGAVHELTAGGAGSMTEGGLMKSM